MSTNLGDMMAEYVKEKQGADTFSTDEGFVIYQIFDNGIMRINNIYIKKEFRKNKLGSKIMDRMIDEVARLRDIKFITASCDHEQISPETSMMSILSYRHKSGLRFRIKPEVKQTNFFMELK